MRMHLLSERLRLVGVGMRGANIGHMVSVGIQTFAALERGF